MKHTRLFCPLAACLLMVWGATASAQFNRFGTRFNNPFRVRFERVWVATLPDTARLIEVGPLANAKDNRLLILVTGGERDAKKRTLLVTHWDGLQFATDTSVDITASPLDALLLGHFRGGVNAQKPTKEQKPAQGLKPAKERKPAKGKKAPFIPPQIVTGEGVYEWTGGALKRLFASPADLKLALILDKANAQLVTGAGSAAVAYDVGDKDARRSTADPPSDGGGYVRFGVGAQDFPGADAMTIQGSTVRYAQSYWDDENKWMIGLSRGKPTTLANQSAVTFGDRLIVFVPRFISREKSFWSLLPEEMEEAWRGEALPGHVLDVRVGDPKNEGRLGILVLTSENKDKERRLYFYRPVQGQAGAP